MSNYDQAYARALRIWKKARRDGWLDEHLRGNTRGKKASKEAFSAGYVCALIDFETVIREKKSGELHQQDYEFHAEGNEKCEAQPRVKPSVSERQSKGES